MMIFSAHLVRNVGGPPVLIDKKYIVQLYGTWMEQSGLTSEWSREVFAQNFIDDLGFGKDGPSLIHEDTLDLNALFDKYCEKRAGYLLFRYCMY
jgi:hypothetical protein